MRGAARRARLVRAALAPLAKPARIRIAPPALAVSGIATRSRRDTPEPERVELDGQFSPVVRQARSMRRHSVAVSKANLIQVVTEHTGRNPRFVRMRAIAEEKTE